MALAYWLHVGEGFSKGTVASACLDVRHFSFSLYTTVLFRLLPPCWNSEGLSRWVCVWVLQEELIGALAVSSTDSIHVGFCSQKLIFLTLGWGLGVGLGLFAPKIALLNFYPCGCWTNLFCVCTPPTSLDGCCFFSSTVVRLPFSSMSDVLEWWLFYILVVFWCDWAKRWAMFAYATILTRSLFWFYFFVFPFFVCFFVLSILVVKLISH